MTVPVVVKQADLNHAIGTGRDDCEWCYTLCPVPECRGTIVEHDERNVRQRDDMTCSHCDTEWRPCEELECGTIMDDDYLMRDGSHRVTVVAVDAFGRISGPEGRRGEEVYCDECRREEQRDVANDNAMFSQEVTRAVTSAVGRAAR